MSEDLLLPENVSNASLKAMFDQAYMNASLNDKGEVIVREEFTYYFAWPESRTRVQIYCLIRALENARPEAKLQYINSLNDKMALLRACVLENGAFSFDYWVPIQGGIPKKTFILVFKFFTNQVLEAINRAPKDIL
jgi:hypothetical protein